ncbi:hypothetical protein PG991_001674 [Apiospora marii]|uniref:Fucose-specific lectin n=2 Tax=Apiospora marii TaxID=335849 RepID=A0ABR1SQH1_9PEZI
MRAMGVGGRLNSYPQEVAPDTRLGAYWPYLLSQGVGASGKLIWTTRWGDEHPEHPFFTHTDPGVDASLTSGLAIVPASSKDKDAVGFIYRRGDGKVFNNMPDRSYNFIGTAWAKGDLAKDLIALTIPAESPLAAFTVAGLGTNPDKLVSTYVLYIDPRGDVNMIWLEDDVSGWKGPQTYPEAFGGADAGTDIACLTPAVWGNANITLVGAYDMSRCYFQAEGGRVRQVQFDGSRWNNLGYLPID